MNQVLVHDFAYATRRLRLARARKPRKQTTALEFMPYKITRRGRFWEVSDATGDLVCLTAYKKGAVEVVKRLNALNGRSPAS